MLRMHSIGKVLGKHEVRRTGFAPHQVSVFSISHSAGNRLVQTLLGFVEAFGGALTGQERLVVGIVIAGQQIGGFCVGTSDHQGRHAIDVSGHARCNQLLHRFGGGHQNLAAHVAAFLDRSQLVFKVNATGASTDHGLHQFIGVEHAAKAGFRVGHDRCVLIHITLIAGANPFGPLDFISTRERIVDALHHFRH